MQHNASNFSAEESLKLINEMIAQAKQDYHNNSFYFLLWGWLLFFTGIGHYLLLQSEFMPYANWLWLIQAAIGGTVSFFHGSKEDRKSGAGNSHVNKTIMNIWLGFGLTLFFIIFSSGQMRINSIPFILLVTGMPTFLSGRILRFPALVWGGISFWLFGIAALYVPEQFTTLLFSAAIFCGYLVPGFALRSDEKRKNSVQRA